MPPGAAIAAYKLSGSGNDFIGVMHPLAGGIPVERAWLDQLYDEVGYLDSFRLVNQEPDQYTWWSNRGQAWAKNVGWRLDYQIISPRLRDKVLAADIYIDERFSDHAPQIMDYDLEILP